MTVTQSVSGPPRPHLPPTNTNSRAARSRHATLALEVASAFARTSTWKEALDETCASVVRNLDAAFARIWTYEPKDRVLLLQASAGMYTHIDGAHAKVPLGAYKIGRIAERLAPHLSNDVQRDPEVSDPAWAAREGLVSFAGYPLIVDGGLVGVAAMFSRTPLQDDTIDALATLADLVAVGIERKKADERSRLSEAQYRLVCEAANEGIWFWNIETNLVEWNDRLISMLGLTRAEWGGTFEDWMRRVHPEDQSKIASSLKAHLEEGLPYEVEFRLLSADGTYRTCTTRGKAERSAEGRLLWMAGAVADIHDRRLAEEALRASEHRHAQILDSVQDIVFCKDLDLKVTYANKAACDYFGATLANLKTSDTRKAIMPNVEDEKRVFESGDVVESTSELTPNERGEQRVFSTLRSPVRDTTGRVTELVGVSRDVTAHRRTEVQTRFLAECAAILASSIEYEKTLANVARIAVPEVADWCAVDLVIDGSIRRLAVAHVDPTKVALAHELEQRWPPKMEDPGLGEVLRSGTPQLVEFASDELLDSTVSDPEMLAVIRELGLRSWMIVPLVSHGATIGAITLVNAESERRYTTADLALATELANRAAIAVENANLYEKARQAVAARDLALGEVKALNEGLELRVAQRTQELADANRELEAFSYTVSHDLRAPIRHVSGFVDLLRDYAGARLDAKATRYVDTIRESAKQMGLLIDGLLDLSRVGRVEFKRVSVHIDEIVSAVIQQLQTSAQGREVEWRVSKLPRVAGDPTMVRAVISNLLSNAFKYTRDATRPVIEVGSLETEDPKESCFYVKDNGAGFNMDYVGKLFGVFQRLHAPQAYEGTGIGLATVKRIVQRHGGRVWAEGVEGNGATFYVCFPAAQSKEEAP